MPQTSSSPGPGPSAPQLEPVITHDGNVLKDMARERSGLDILASGGCAWKGNYHENGAAWHPHVMPWGEMKCVTCSCKVSSKGTLAMAEQKYS